MNNLIVLTKELCINFGIVALLVTGYSLLCDYVKRKNFLLFQIFVGVLFAFISLIAMNFPVTITKGVIIDARSIILPMAAFFEGVIPAIIAFIIILIYRIFLGGIGVAPAIVNLISGLIIGLVFYFFINKKIKNYIILRLFIFGLLITFSSFFSTLLLPVSVANNVLKSIWLGVLISYPLGVITFGFLLNETNSKNKFNAELIKSEEKYRFLTENILDVIWVLDVEKMKFTYISPSVKKLMGYTAEEVMKQPVKNALTPLSQEELNKIMPHRIASFIETKKSEVYVDEMEQPCKDGSTIWTEVISYYRFNLKQRLEIIGTSRDISARKKAEDELNQSLNEKELLLAEIHHRVKNNLQVVSAIIKLETSFIKDNETIKHLNNTSSRIDTMGLLHKKLYLSKDFRSIDMYDYIKSIVEQVVSIQFFKINNIKISYDIENVFMNIETAMPCGMIINEIITNSFKYAFIERNIGKIDISIKRNGNEYSMSVYDDGVGIPKNIDFNNNCRLGLKLIDMLTMQLQGSVVLDRNNGTLYNITFKELFKEEKRWQKKS
ncbi:MAG: hypothetical protein A2086_11855 [Spirochaetes bacterium GWD1_27_9]|nr:MAG: hypothetical protein A2Y34_16170 [Spirochaetes bacterium GWC1_27_15]OHD28653.1 MAG: hypothetical protein A2086_11855 [Spirochaetes bacterium GWD1_27_9]